MEIENLIELGMVMGALLREFKKILESKKMKDLTKLKITADLKPKFERSEKDIERLMEEIKEFIKNEDYSCDEFKVRAVKHAKIASTNFKEFIEGLVEAYGADPSAFKKVVKDKHIYLIVEKWANILEKDENITLGKLLVSALDITKAKYEQDEMEDDSTTIEYLDFIIELLSHIQDGTIKGEVLQNKIQCLVDIQPNMLSALGFSEEDIEEGKNILGIEDYWEEMVRQIIFEVTDKLMKTTETAENKEKDIEN